jgi:hypothetical protein
MREPRKLGEQSEPHAHANIGQRLGIAIFAADAGRLIAKDLEFILATHFNLAISRPFGLCPLAGECASGAKLGLIDGPLAGREFLIGRQDRFIRHNASLGNTPFTLNGIDWFMLSKYLFDS